ncbi:MAG: polysaccharide biosynthesis protein, partial [Robiginitomaculum sp.]
MRKIPRTAIMKVFVALFDSALGGLAMYGVMRLRYIYEGKMAPNHIDIKAAVIFGLTCLIIWMALRLHRAVWRYTSLDDIGPLMRGVFLATLITPLVLFLFFNRAADFPRSAPFIVAPLFLILLLTSRAVVLLFYKRDLRSLFRRSHKHAKKALLIGRSHALHDHLRDHAYGSHGGSFHITGLIDTGGDFKGRSIRGVPVMGAIEDIPTALRSFTRANHEMPTLIMVDETADRGQLNTLVKIAAENKASLVRFGHNIKDGLTPFEATDLIGRKAKKLDITPVRGLIQGRRVMITGAGGTIGSELTRQVSLLDPARLTLIDHAEFNLYRIDQQLSETKPCDWHPYLGDIQDVVRMREIFAAEKPEIILHAAALKHVPLSEINPIEAVNTNVGGTNNIITLATEFGTDSFTLISTDKAVSPSNIMGATKRIAEMATLAAATQSPILSACAVRFGN